MAGESGNQFGAVESVKAVAELYTPVADEVVEVNKGAAGDPGIVNDDPYAHRWLIELKFSSDEEAGTLMSSDQCADYVQSEEKER